MSTPDAQPEPSPPSRDRYRAVVPLAVLLGLGLRLVHLRESLWYDELFATGLKLGSWPRLGATLLQDVHPPLHHLVMTAWIAVFGDGVVSVRALPFFCGLLVIWQTARLAASTFGVGAGRIAAVLVATSPVMIEYSTEARPYMPLVALVLAQFAAFRRMMAAPGGAGRRWIWGLLAAAGALTHHYAAVATVIQVAWGLARGRRDGLAVASLAALPALAYLLVRSRLGSLPTTLEHLSGFDLAGLGGFVGEWALGGDVLRPLAAEAPAWRVARIVVLGVAGGLGLIGLGADLRTRSARATATMRAVAPRGAITAMALGLPLLLLLVGLLGRQGFFVPRAALWCLPFLFTLVAAGVAGLSAPVRRIAVPVGLALVATVLVAWASDGRRWRQADLAGAARDLAADFAPSGPPSALFTAAFRPQPLEYYQPGIGERSAFEREARLARELEGRLDRLLPASLASSARAFLEEKLADLERESAARNASRRLVVVTDPEGGLGAALAARPDLRSDAFSVIVDAGGLGAWRERHRSELDRDWREARRNDRHGLVTLRFVRR
ncbi:MAG: glycosyltransferase family 39 protein [Planctomycetota bacterium]